MNNEDSINSNDIIIEIILFSLQNLGKIFKSLIEENKQNKNNNSKIYKDIIKQISKLYQELIDKKNSSEISNLIQEINYFSKKIGKSFGILFINQLII